MPDTSQREKIFLKAAKRASSHSWNSILPSISVSANDEFEFHQNTNNFSLEGKVSLSISSDLFTSMKKAKLNYEAKKISFDEAVSEITAIVKESYYSLLLEKQNLELLKESLENAKIQTEQNEERYVSFLKNGLDADVILEAYPDEKFTATVSEVSPVPDEATRTKEVILNFSKTDSRINAGMFAAVNLYLKDFENVLSVPTSCIIEKGQKKFIYLIEEAENNIAHFTEIKTGEEIVDRTIIEFVESAKEGAKVVTQGFETLQDGSEVNIAGDETSRIIVDDKSTAYERQCATSKRK